jgi:ABC-type multidrug transport system fused ATPase/permease subunit
VESTLRDVCTDLVPSVLTLVGTAAVMVAVDWRLGLIGLVVAPLVFPPAPTSVTSLDVDSNRATPARSWARPRIGSAAPAGFWPAGGAISPTNR